MALSLARGFPPYPTTNEAAVRAAALATAVLSFSPVLYYNMGETASPTINRGSITGTDAVGTSCTFGAAGLFSGFKSVAFDQSASKLATANSTGFTAQTTITVVAIINATTAPATGSRIAQNTGDQFNFNLLPAGGIEVRVNRATTNAQRISSDGTISYPTGRMLVAMTFDTTDSIKIYTGKNGLLTLLSSFSTDTAGSGAATAMGSTAYNIGNSSANTRALSGFYYLHARYLTVLTSGNLQTILTASGV